MELKDKLEKIKNNNAHKVFEGEIFDVYQWPQEMFDGHIATFERIVRPDTAIIFPVMGDNFVMNIERQPGSTQKIDFPMGRIEKDEDDASDAALRELKEETGITPKELYYISSERPDGKIFWDLHFFIAKEIFKREELSLDSGELIENIEFPIIEIYKKFKALELELPKVLLKVLINNSMEEFIDRFKNPSNYFEKIDLQN